MAVLDCVTTSAALEQYRGWPTRGIMPQHQQRHIMLSVYTLLLQSRKTRTA
jgi:hypothetical protein